MWNMGLEGFYRGNYTRYLIVPAVLFAVFLFLIFIFPGISTGIDLKGGTLHIVRSSEPLDSAALETHLGNSFPLSDLQVTSISSPLGHGVTIQYAENEILGAAKEEVDAARGLLGGNDNEAIQRAFASIELSSKYVEKPNISGLSAEESVEAANIAYVDAKENFRKGLEKSISDTFSLGSDAHFRSKEVDPTLGATFWESAIFVAGIALLIIVAVILFFFREIVPSVAVIAAAVFDIASALALMAIFKVPLSLSSIPALLMLVGYSVDTDIMLTTRLLKRMEKSPEARTIEAMKTGLTMTLTTMAAASAMIAIAYFAQIVVIYEIAAVLLFGLVGDLVSTWMMNAPVLLWYVENKRSVKV